jgi:hypothetical protein
MRRLPAWLVAACLSGVVAVAAQPGPDSARGGLLYTTHCVGCHTTQVHWRDRTLATDWSSLRTQVFRWQANTGLDWSDDEIVAVTRYLNDLYYRFPTPDIPVAWQRLPREPWRSSLDLCSGVLTAATVIQINVCVMGMLPVGAPLS